MIVSTSNAEKQCSIALQELENANDWSVIHFITNRHIYGESLDVVQLQVATNSIEKMFTDTSNIQLYFMLDGDAVLFIPEVEEGDLKKIQALIEDTFSFETDESKIYSLYNSLDVVKEMVEQKYKISKDWQKKNKLSSKKEVKLDEKYVKQLLEERKKREGLHILLVEDEPFTLKLIEGILQEHTVIKATNGHDAVESYMLNAPDIVFLDINLPGIDGHKVLERILEFDPDCYVVMLSGNTLMKDISHSLNKGAKGFVVKPFPKEKLLNYVGLYKSIKEEKNCLNKAV